MKLLRSAPNHFDDEDYEDQVQPAPAPRQEELADDSDIIHLLDILEQRLTSSQRLPLSRKILVLSEDYHELLDRMRLVSQGGVRQARSVVRLRETLLAEVRGEAARMLREAEARRADMLSESRLFETARQLGARIIAESEEQAAELMAGADNYARGVLLELRDDLRLVEGRLHDDVTDAAFQDAE